MRKLTVLLLACTGYISTNSLFAQAPRVDQVFGLGGSTSNISGMARSVSGTSVMDINYSARLRQFGIVYGPRVDVLAWKSGSLSISSPLMLGFASTDQYRSIDYNGSTRDTIEGLRGTSFAVEVPVFADLNIGLHSAADESLRKHFGLFIGAGYAYNFAKVRTSIGKLTYDGFDPVFRAGIRMGRTWENRFSLALTVRGNLNANSVRSYGLQLLKEL
ncbi:MAG: hypothetical protein V4450_04685 [Bacteroidota bacterium]